MKQWRFEVYNRSGFTDVHGAGIFESIAEFGIEGVKSVSSSKVFLIEGDFDEVFADRVGSELLAAPVCEDYCLGRRAVVESGDGVCEIEVHLKSGVTDPVAESVTAAIADMGVEVGSVRTARKYIIKGDIIDREREIIKKRVLANDCIELCIEGAASEPPSPHLESYKLEVRHWPILNLDDEGLVALSKGKDLFLDAVEMRAIQAYFKEIGREPTDLELETIAQTWSEHCVHKTLKSSVDMECDGQTRHYDNLIKETIFASTKELDKDWCISVFEDNAGVVEFDEDSAICFKVETHNHPSALDPYGGAATGIGGVIRDPMGTGMGAKPIANTDIFCFGLPDKKLDEVPKGVLHPKRIMKGVVSGVRDYGNRMGIPTVNGAIYFDDRYMANPLVFCGNLGLMDRKKCFKHQSSGDLIVVVGGRTGRDGIHGDFSSGQMTHEHETIFSHAVQIGNAITEKKTLDVLLQARDRELYESITDCGAGGLSSAVGEMGEKLGADVELKSIPLKYAGLSYTEIWISEAQERMVIAVRPEKLEEIMGLFSSEDVEATVIGKFTDDKKLRLKYDGQLVCEMDMDFLHGGVPKYSRKAKWESGQFSEPVIGAKGNYNEDLLKILGSYNVASKEWVIRQYDHEVQGGSVVKPLTGASNDGPSDAAVIRPKYDSDRGVALSCGMNPLYGDIDPYWMAMSAIDEAVRNIVSVGGRADRIALLDNYCWGDCRRVETFGSLVRASQACYDGAMAYGSPFVSGKDSLNNEFSCDDGSVIAIPSTLLISAMTIVDDVNNCVTMDLKDAGNCLFVVGLTRNELGGSHYYKVNGHVGANVPVVDLAMAPKIAAKISEAISVGLVRSCHDCSEGGLGVALAEMAFAGEFGVEADLTGLAVSEGCDSSAVKLFSESNSRYVVEVETGNFDAFCRLMLNLPFGKIGVVTEKKVLEIRDGGSKVVDADLGSLKSAWQKPLAWK